MRKVRSHEVGVLARMGELGAREARVQFGRSDNMLGELLDLE